MKIDFENYKDEFIEKLGTFDDYKIEGIADGYPRNSLFFSEALSIYSLSNHFEIDILIESGVFRGGSTMVWGRTLPDVQVEAVDILESPKHERFWPKVKESLSCYPNLNFTIGDGNVKLPELIEENSDKKIGVFVDGPKDSEGLALIEKCAKYKNVCFSALHDYTHPYYFSTQTNVEFRKIAGNMDEKHPQIQQYPNGPGLTVIVGGDDE